jgi:hypothetical protein
MCPDAPYFIILLCLTLDDFTRQGESTGVQWVNQTICPWCPVNPLSGSTLLLKSSGARQSKIIKLGASGHIATSLD